VKFDWHSIVNFLLVNLVLGFIFHTLGFDSVLLTWIVAFLVGLVWPWPMVKKNNGQE